MNQSLLDIIHNQLTRINIPNSSDKVFKEECVLSFDNSFSDGGIYINLMTWMAFGRDYYINDSIKTGCKIYLHQKFHQIFNEIDEKVADEPTKLAIGIEGGFSTERHYEIIKEYSLVVIDESRKSHILTWPTSDNVPEYLQVVISNIIEHEGMKSRMQVSSWNANDEKIITKYGENLLLLNNGKKISNDPSTWKCELSGDTNNLWLNLSTGYIGGGRKNWDGSGGSGGALKHFEDTGKLYPLCVKLGTITPNGADVWSYAEDEDTLVIDPKLPEHLAHWGIDIMKLEKTEKTLNEMEVELNMKYDWSRILESGENLELLCQPEFIGIRNIGSSCYLNSVMQSIFSLSEIKDRYFNHRENILATLQNDPTDDLIVQMSKIADALMTNKYIPIASEGESSQTTFISNLEGDKSKNEFEKFSIAPYMFKHLIGKNHVEFSSSKQQDAYEYFLHLLDTLSQAEKLGLEKGRIIPYEVYGQNVDLSSNLFEFYLETKYVCQVTGQVKYSKRSNVQSLMNAIDLRIPLDKATNTAEVCDFQEKKKLKIDVNDIDDVKLIVPFEEVLSSYFSDEIIELKNPSLGYQTPMTKSLKFQSFPRFLVIKLGRYYVDSTWKQVKVDALVPMPEILDLSMYRGHGLQDREVLMVDNETSTSTETVETNTITADESIVMQLMSMGFSENGCRKAAIATLNADVELALNWIISHMEDADFNEPIESSIKKNVVAENIGINDESLSMIVSMGYTEKQALAALKTNNNDLERAVEWIFSHIDDLDSAVNSVLNVSSSRIEINHSTCNIPDNASGKYELVAVISHIGKNTDHGHYVCHIKKNGIWAIFNDEKVCSTLLCI